MRKVTLEIESLAVESFSTCPAPEARSEKADRGRMSADCTIVVCTDWWDCTA